MEIHIQDHFRKAIVDLFGESGERWLAHLPVLLETLEHLWNIQIGLPFELSYNYVAPATLKDGAEAVIKVGHPNAELTSEMVALRHYDGRGIVQLLEQDGELGAMLLERLSPGVPLAQMDDDEMATRIAAGVMRQLWLPAPDDPQRQLCTAVKWARGFGRLRQAFGGATGPFPARLVEQAERLFDDLLASSGPDLLLHGDLHHWNILSARRQPWLALDPKGLVGEAEYEIGAFTRNRWPANPTRSDLKRQADLRLSIFQEMLGFDRRRMLEWCMAQAVLSAWWSYEDHHDVDEGMIFFAEVLSEMIG